MDALPTRKKKHAIRRAVERYRQDRGKDFREGSDMGFNRDAQLRTTPPETKREAEKWKETKGCVPLEREGGGRRREEPKGEGGNSFGG